MLIALFALSFGSMLVVGAPCLCGGQPTPMGNYGVWLSLSGELCSEGLAKLLQPM